MNATRRTLLLSGAALLLGVFIWLAPKAPAPAAQGSAPAPTLAEVRPVIAARCLACHASAPTLMAAAPAGLKLDSDEALYAQRQRVVDQAVRLKAMPLGNVTQMTDAERALLARWAAGGFAR